MEAKVCQHSSCRVQRKPEVLWLSFLMTHTRVCTLAIGKHLLNINYRYQGFSLIGSWSDRQSNYWCISSILCLVSKPVWQSDLLLSSGKSSFCCSISLGSLYALHETNKKFLSMYGVQMEYRVTVPCIVGQQWPGTGMQNTVKSEVCYLSCWY